MDNNTAAGGGRRRAATKHSAEDQALDQIAKEQSGEQYYIHSNNGKPNGTAWVRDLVHQGTTISSPA